MDQNELKKAVAQAAANYVRSRLDDRSVIGIGTGSTANYFIECLAAFKHDISATVASSEETARRLKALQITVIDLNSAPEVSIYVDGADEIDPQGHMRKGGGGALTREKIVAQLAQSFICICDGSKQVDVMGKFPLPVEIIPMAHAQVARELEKLGGAVTLRKVKASDSVYVTDNQGWILDVAGLSIKDPVGLESQINQIPGVVCNGLFARRKANVLLIGESTGVRRQTY